MIAIATRTVFRHVQHLKLQQQNFGLGKIVKAEKFGV